MTFDSSNRREFERLTTEDLIGRIRTAMESGCIRPCHVYDLMDEALDRLQKSEPKTEAVATTEKSSAVGNAAAMREALIFAEQVLSTAAHNVRGETGMIVDSDYAEAARRCKSALAAPARNCDRFGGDYNRLRAAWWDWTASPSGRKPDGTTKMSFTKWLFAPAAERKGEGDGRH